MFKNWIAATGSVGGGCTSGVAVVVAVVVAVQATLPSLSITFLPIFQAPDLNLLPMVTFCLIFTELSLQLRH